MIGGSSEFSIHVGGLEVDDWKCIHRLDAATQNHMEIVHVDRIYPRYKVTQNEFPL